MSTQVKQSPYLYPVRDAVDNDKVKLVPVAKDFYIEASRKISRKRKKLQRSGECFCPKKYLWKCDGDCDRCRWHVKDDSLILDAPCSEDACISLADTIVADAPLPEEVIEDKALLDALYRELAALDSKGRRTCELLSQMSEREAAEAMGLSRSSFKRYWAKLKVLLAERLGDYR